MSGISINSDTRSPNCGTGHTTRIGATGIPVPKTFAK